MSKWAYTDSLLHLQKAHTKITSLLATVSSLAPKNSTMVKLSFLGIKPVAAPQLYVWLKHYKSAIYSKVSVWDAHCMTGLTRETNNLWVVDSTLINFVQK